MYCFVLFETISPYQFDVYYRNIMKNMPSAEAKQLYLIIESLLKDAYGESTFQQYLKPVDELVCTILSQATSDGNRDLGFNALRARYASWEAVIAAPMLEVRDTIRSAGLANMKAPRIQNALRTVRDRRGEITLDFLADMPLQDALDWLVEIDGVGPKTAAIIMLFAFNRPAFPVDTHVHRMAKRLGLIGEKVSAEKAHKILIHIGPPRTYYAFHLNTIRHGRQVCVARKPKCGQCVLQAHCRYFAAQDAAQGGGVK